MRSVSRNGVIKGVGHIDAYASKKILCGNSSLRPSFEVVVSWKEIKVLSYGNKILFLYHKEISSYFFLGFAQKHRNNLTKYPRKILDVFYK